MRDSRAVAPLAVARAAETTADLEKKLPASPRAEQWASVAEEEEEEEDAEAVAVVAVAADAAVVVDAAAVVVDAVVVAVVDAAAAIGRNRLRCACKCVWQLATLCAAGHCGAEPSCR
jgi:hypothetical protein